MVEFERSITAAEVRSYYLNLTSDSGKRFGELFPEHRTKFVVIDGKGRATAAQKHNDNQFWGMLKNWFIDNDVQPGDRVSIKFDPDERRDGQNVVHLILEAASALRPKVQEEEAVPTAYPEATEIPISLEKQLEDFVASNLSLIEPGLVLFVDEDNRQGKQYPTDVGVIDLLCRRSDGSLLVIELKRGKSSDVVVGQISRYIGWVKVHMAKGAAISGLILTHDKDESLKYAVLAHASLALKYFRLRLELVSEEQLKQDDVAF